MNQFLSKVNRYVIALIGVLVLGISSVYAGTAYTNGRAFLKQGSPTGGGKVYVASNATEPTSGQYKAVTSSTSPAFNVQVDGNATFHYWAVANAGYIFTGWYTAEGALQSSGAAHISKAVTAGTAGTSDTHAYADFYASFIKQIQLSFVVPTNGSFTITHKGSEVTPAYSSFTTEGKVVLTALPADGYKLRGWYTTTNGGVTKNYFAFGNSCEPNFTSNTTIGAEFVPDDGKATFWIKGTNFIYDNLTDANTKAASVSSKMIVVVSDGVVGAGTYTISSGVTLLIPYEETYTLMTKPNIKHIPSPNAASKVTSIFRKLTLASGATVNVSGNICIGGSIASCNGGSPSSFPTGPVGMLDLSRGGTINLASGSNLYAWGYVKGQDMDQGNNTAASGVGEINAASGATVWEDYQVGEWRGGTASSTIYNNKGSWKFFPFQSYTIQNIEAPVNYVYGSNLKCFWTIFGNGSVYDVNFPLIASSGSLFKLASGGTVRKWYDPTIDHVCFELGGTAALDALTLSVMGETVSSSDYYLPIPANLKIILKSGNSLTVSKPMTMHAGSVVEVKSGATLNVNNRVHLFDADDWDTYCMYAYYYRTYYSPSLHFNRGEGTAKTNLEDATVIVDGTVDVKGAYLYSSAHGSNICGNGGGTFKYAALPSNTTMTQCKVLKDNVSVNIRSANLHNDNGTYTKGIASTTFKNVNGRWFTNAKSTEKANHTYDFTYIKSGDVYGTGGTNGTVAACYSKDKTGLELQNKWANIKAEGCDNWWTGIDDSHLYNWTLNSAWHQYIKTGSTAGEEGEDPIETYAGSDGKIYTKQGCDITPEGTIDANCLYTVSGVKKALVNGSFIAVVKNTEDEAYHKSDAATTYYLCFDGCVWHPATKNAENLYTVDGTKYIWYGDKWMAVEYDSGVALHYSLSATNVKIYYDYVDHAWVLATPVAEVVTSAGTEQVFSLANAITKAKAGGTNVTIRLLKNISGTISYDGTNNCGLDLNGFTLSSSTSGMITVNSATATFIIKDQSAAGTGKVQLSYSANTRRYAISVTKGHLVVNSGTISAINTSAYASGNTTVDVGAITVANGHKVTVNGGSIEAISDHNPYGIYLAGATAMATINGGTIEAKTTERSSSVDSPYGIIGAGSIYVNGGTVKATCYRSSSSRGISSSGTFTMTGGSVIATASSTCYGVYAASGSNTTISGGTVTSTTTGGTARALISYATATVSGGTLTATAGGSDAKGIYVANGTTTVNAGAVVNATATTKAYGIYYADNTPTVTVNGGAFTVSTTSTTEAYGVYAVKGTATINDGMFTVTAKTTGAEGMHVETANTPKLTLNGGKFMVKNSNGSADGTINNTGATLANFSMAGGYFNVAPNGTTNIAAGKTVKDLDATVEASLISAGYTKKIAGNEYTVTWCKMGGNTGSNILKTEKWESGKVPVWTGADPDLNTTGVTRVFAGWNTGTWNSGTAYPIGTPLPAITDHDVTYYAINRPIYAEVIADGKDSLFTSAQSAWKYAMKKTQATIRIKTQLGTEASVGNMTQMVFNPDNANSIITLDLNGLSWTMGNHKTDGVLDAENKNVFLNVAPTKANCKLIITDNSASGNGYLMNSWAKTDGDLRCVEVNAGELVLQKGGIKVKNTDADHYSQAVVVSGNNAHFTMTGGTVYSTDGKSPRGVNVANGYADIAGGTVEANSTASEAYALLSYDTVTVSGGATLRAIGATGSTYGAYCNGAAAVLNIDSAIIISNAYQTAKGIYSLGGGQTTVDGKSSISATTTTGSGAYALYATGANTKITTNAGSYTATSALNSAYGVYAENSGAVILNDGSFTVTAAGTNARGVYAQSNATVTVKDGSFNVTSDTHADPSSFGAYAAGGTVNIEDGNFTLNVHKDLSNRNCDLARCGTGVSYLNISGGTFAGDSAYHAVRSFGGETTITGNPVFTAQRGVDAGAWASADGTAKVTIDGGTFYCTDNFALYATTHTYNGKTVVGDMTVLDGKFHTKSSIKPIYTSSRPSYLKIKGGYFTSYTASDISRNALDSFVVAPSTTTAVESTDPMYASPNDYRYRVNTKFTVTWKDGATTLKTQEYNRNEIPSYGGDYNPSTSAETYEFLGWSPAIGPVTKDTTYTALKQKYEAEVFETGSATTKRYTTFEAAWADVQKIENGTLRILSNCYKGTTLTYNPAPAEGVAEGTPGYFTTATTTIDLNGHTYNNYTSTTDTYALEMKKAGCKLIITDTSGKTSGYFGHMNYNAPNCRYRGVKLEKGELVLAGGTLRTQNTYPYLADDSEDFSSSGAYTVLVYAGTTFTMTGGTLLAEAHKNARAVCFVGNGVANISGGEIKVLAQYKKKDDATQYYGAGAYGVIADNSGGTANISGTVTITSKAYSSAIGVYVNASTNAAEANISGGSIDCWAKTQASMPVYCYQTKAVTNISGGSFKANCSQDASAWNTETVSVHKGATVNISGGTYESTTGSNCNAVRNFGGTVTITGNPLFKTRQGVNAGDYAEATATATVYVNGGTFNNKGYCFYANTSTNDNGTVTGKVYVNAGYFNSYGGSICSGTAGTNLVLNGGYYKERSGTSTKTNITTYKGATTTVSTLSPAITVADTTYHYQLLTDFDITWLGGESYSKVTQVKSGVVPTNTDLDGKCFLRNDSAFYFTGWTPTPIGVIGDATYNAAGVYHEAKVTVSAQDSIFDNFEEAWAYAMDQASATITLLTNLTRTTSLVYQPTVANARHTFDLNNFTIQENTTDRLLIVNKADAKLTITDNSSEKGGRLYKKMDCSVNICTSVIYHGELILAGGKLYVENTKDERVWHPAECVHVSRSTDGIFTMTGGTVESQANYLAYTLYNYATTNISGGTIIANATTQGSAQGLYAVAGTATISGGTWNITSETSGAVGVAATGWVNTTGTPRENGVLNITGGTFNVSAATSNVQGFKSYAVGKRIDGTNYTARGIVNVSGGTFNVTCSAATATQVFAAQVDGWRLFDEATPHNMIGEERGEMNISGGTFTVDTRDNGAWVENGGNVDLLRCWGNLNVTGGNFTIYQNNSSPCAIGVYRGKTTVSGNPVFNVYAHTSNARGVEAGIWQADTHCDANAANNLAEAEINGGTFKVITEGSNTEGVYAVGALSSSGYAMNAKITVNGGEFLCICPNLDKHYPMVFSSVADRVGTYGTAKSEIYVNGGKVKSRKGTEADNTTTGAVNCHNATGKIWLTGGYYETNAQLTARKADTCDIVNITSAEIDPEYNNGYRYRIDIHYVAQVTATGIDRKFATLKGALDYARTINNSTVTILDDCNFETDGQYGYALGTIGKTMTIDLNNHTVNATNSETSYDRVFAVTGQITITDNSVAKGGKLNLTKAHNGTFLGIVFNDASQLTLANGTIYVENETASKAVEALNIWGTTGIFRQTGGTLQAKATSATATGIQMRGTAEISGGNVIVTSDGYYARAFVPAADAGNSKYGSITVSGTPTITVSGAGEVSGVYANVAGTTTTISGGTWNITSTTSTAYGVRLSKANTATISGGTFNVTATTTNAYGIYVSGGGLGTVSGGTFTSRTGANKNESFGAYATGTGTTLNITGGTFDVNSADNAGSNINVVRVQPGATVTISGGTFRSGANNGHGLVAFGGVTTVSGTALFEAQTGAYVGSWYSGDGTNDELATVNLNGGTFNVKGVAINVTWNTRYKDGVYLDSPFVNSIVNVNGGRYKTTGGTIVQKKANGADGGTAVLHIAGGYFNEKSGTTFKDQISPYVADTSRINTLDPLYEGTYKYEVSPHYVAKVKTGSTTTYYTTAKRALDYAKTVANPTITLLDNCTLTDANYTINPGNWTGTLDLNNFTLTPTVDAENGRAFTIGGTGTKFIVTDNSVGQGGQIYYKGNSSVSIIYFVVAGGEMELAGGTLYVENTNASKKAIGFVVDGNPSQFTQSGGTFTIKGAYGANGYYGRGTATFTGGTMNVDGGAHQAIGLFPQESTSKLNVSGTFALNVTSSLADSYGVLVKNSGATGTISGGKFNFNQNTMVGAQLDGILTITGGYFVEHPSQAGRYKSQIAAFVPDTCDLNMLDPLYEGTYKYEVAPHYVASVTHGVVEKKFVNLNDAFEYAKTVANPTITLLKNATFAGPYTFTPTVANWRGTLDLNNFEITSTTTTDRFFTNSNSTAKLTITDNSGAKGGVWNFVKEYNGALIGIVIDQGELILTGGKLHTENTMSAKSATGVNIWGTSAKFTQTGGTLEVTSPTNPYGVSMRGTTNISGGEINVTTAGSTPRALFMTSYGKLNVSGNPHISASGNSGAYGIYFETAGDTVTVSGSPVFDITAANSAYGIRACGANSLATVSGGTFNVTTTSGSGAYVINLITSAHVNVSGGAFNATSANENAFGIHSETSAEATVNDGVFTSRTAAGKQSSFAAYAAGGSMTITRGTFDASSANGSGNNLNVVRVNKGATMNISGGTFTGSPSTGNGVCVYGGTTTISGNPVFNTRNGVSAGSWCNSTGSDTWTATVIINGGTFNTSGGCPIIAEWCQAESNILNSDITINGGHFKSTGSSMISKEAAGAGAATVTINGGYFNEKATGTTYRTQVNNSVASGHEVIDLDTDDAEYAAGYRYVVTADPVAKVKVGSSVTYHPTVAAAFTAANAATSASTITMLKDATATSYMHYTGSQNCTLDLNGHTISYDGTTTEHRLLRINNADITFTVTDNTVSKEGKLLFNTSKAATSYGVVVIHGNFQLDAGTIEMHASGGTAEGVTPYNSGTSVTINGGKVYVVTTNSQPGYGAYSKNGTTTINGGTIQVEAAGAGYGIYYSAGITTVTDGKFNISGSIAYATNLSAANANMIIQGGWYTTNTRLKPNAPYQVLSLADQSPYLYEVAEAYTLTWTTDGDPLTGSYTSGLTKPGTTITVPNTPTKTGYTFSAWTPAVAATMPAANTTYTATWTINSFDVTFNMQGHGAAIAKQTIDYNGLVTEPATPTEANYVFGGWYKEAGCTNEWDFASDHVTAATTLYAKWTEAVASVKVGDDTDYFTTIDAAFNFANDQEANMEIKLLRDATAAASLDYTAAYNCTLDLNHHTLSGSVTKLINVNASGKTLTIDDTSAEKDGMISMIGSGNARLQALYITAGTVNLKHGKIYSKNEAVYASNKSATAAAVYVADGQSFIMDDGTVESEAQYGSYAIYAYEGTSKTKTITIKGGLVKGHTNLGTTAAGIYARTTKLTVNGGTIIGHAWTSTAYGVYVRAGSATLNGGRIEATNDTISNNGTKTTYGIYARGPITIPAASTVNVYAKARTTTAAAVYVYATITGNTIAGGTFTAKAGTTTARGIHSEGDITISGGTFNVNAASPTGNTNAPCGIYSPRGTVTVEGNPTFNVTSGASRAFGAFAYGTIGDTGAESTKFSGTININGGTFNVTTTTTTACGVYTGLQSKPVAEGEGNVAGTHYMPGIISITDGTFNVTATINTAYGIVLAAQQSETVGGVTTDRVPTATITGGKFNVVSTGNSSKAYAMNTTATNTALRVEGGWYSTKKMDDGKNMETKYTADGKTCNYRVLPLEGESPYLWEVAEAYSLTWNLDGGTVTTAGTMADVDATGTPSGYVKPGASITAPVIARDGYTFASWSPTVAATMPSSNTTYTAQWTVNSYTIRFLNYDGSVLQSSSVNYGETPVYSGETPSKPADATYTYTFDTWSPAITAVSKAQDYTAQFRQTENVASVTANASGYTRYYTDFSDAFKAVKEATVAVTITLLKDVSSPALVYSGINTDCTLDLNGHTLTNTNTSAQVAVNIYKAGTTFTITDKTESKSGQIRIESTNTTEAYGLYVYAGHLKLEAGTIYASLAANTCAGVRAVTANSSFTMDGGTIHLVTTGTNNGIGVMASDGTTVINGGTIQVEAAADGYGINRTDGTVTVNGGKFNISASGSAYATNQASANANVVIKSGYYTTNSRLNPTAPYHVFDLTGESPYRYEVAEGYTLTWALDGGSITTPGTPAGIVKSGAALTAPTVTKTGYTFAGWSPAVAETMPATNTTYTATWTMDEVGDRLDIVDWTATNLTINANGWSASGWPYTINGIEYAKDARAADRTLEIPYSGEAGTDLRITVESGGSIIRQHYYRIPFIGTADGVSESDIIYVNSGNLTINASSTPRIAALYIRPEASVSITGGTLAIDKLVLRTLPWQAAAINGSFTAAETWYTRIAPNKRTITGPYAPITYESSSYYQFALPLNCTAKLKDVQVSHGANTPYGNTWLLKRYNEETRAANGTGEANWVVLDKEEYIQGGVGYEMSSNSNYYREFYFPLGAVNSASIGTTTAVSFHSGAAGAQHAGWNWVASPLMGVFDNSGADPETGMKIGWLLTDGSYDQGIPDYIYPAIPFSYQTSSGQSTISFAGSSIVASVPFRRVAAQEETVRLQWIHLDIQDTTGVGDHTSILAHPMRYDETYKPGIDVAKQSFTASRALLYSSHAYGEMAFAGVSDSLLMRGVPLTIYSPVAQELTISMRANNWLDRLDHVWLVDYETGVRTDLLIGDYTFNAAAGTTAGRLVLEGQFKTPQIITGNEDVQDESTKPVKYIYQDKMYIQKGDKVYDATGKLVNKK